MNRIFCTILALVFCNTVSLILANGSHSDLCRRDTTHYICQQSEISTDNSSTERAIAKTRNESATVVDIVNSVESNLLGNIFSKEKSCDSHFSHQNIAKSPITFIISDSQPLIFSRSIDHYVYAIHHIII